MSVENEALMAAVRGRLMQDSRIAALTIDVACADGHVSLIGCVDTDEQRVLAVELITGMIGVRNVKDELRVRTSTTGAAEVEDSGWLKV